MVRRDGNNWDSHPCVRNPKERCGHTLFLVVAKYHIQHFLDADIKLSERFSYLGIPGLVLFSKSILERVIRIVLRDLRLIAPLITRRHAVLLADNLREQAERVGLS